MHIMQTPPTTADAPREPNADAPRGHEDVAPREPNADAPREPDAPGLRERKRRATRRAIEEAAVSLAYESGYEAATIEAICKVANVSLRTFFNYFPSKDAAILGEEFAPVGAERARELLDEHAPDLLAGATAAWVETAPPQEDPSLLVRRRDVAHRNPQLMQQRLTSKYQLQKGVVRAVAEYLGEHPELRRLGPDVPEAEEAEVMVALVATAARHAVDVWASGDSDAPLSPAFIRGTLEHMAEILRKEP